MSAGSHLDIGDLPNLLAAELGVMTVRLERAIRSLDGVARVHVNRWGDGSAHLHMWFLARPYGRLQLRGTFLSLWDDILPVIPEHQWRENLALVAAWLAEFGGRPWPSPRTLRGIPVDDSCRPSSIDPPTAALEIVDESDSVGDAPELAARADPTGQEPTSWEAGRDESGADHHENRAEEVDHADAAVSPNHTDPTEVGGVADVADSMPGTVSDAEDAADEHGDGTVGESARPSIGTPDGRDDRWNAGPGEDPRVAILPATAAPTSRMPAPGSDAQAPTRQAMTPLVAIAAHVRKRDSPATSTMGTPALPRPRTVESREHGPVPSRSPPCGIQSLN